MTGVEEGQGAESEEGHKFEPLAPPLSTFRQNFYISHIKSYHLALCFLSCEKTPGGAGNTLYRTSTSPQAPSLILPDLVMQFYSRTQQPGASQHGWVAPAGSFPNAVVTPDGCFHLGMPLRAAASADRPSLDPLSNGSPPSSGILVLMHPGAPDENSSPRAPLFVGLLCDFIVLFAILYELRWREVETEFLLTIGLMGLVVAAVGFFSCYLRMPSMLGFFAMLCLWQGVASALPCQSMPQLLHVVLQPCLVSFSLTLRRTRIPMCFNTGRTRRR